MTLPAGFERLLLGHAIAVARSDFAPHIRQALVGADGVKATLHDFASRQAGARPLAGRGVAYSFQLKPTNTRVVVRHNRHGGLFAPITGDRFFSPTRAPFELDVSLALAKAGIPTPDIIAYAVYPPGGILQRSDVCSKEVPASRDLAEILRTGADGDKSAALDLTAGLVASLSRAGARHHDLNAKNVLITSERAYVLDVDRVTMGEDPERALRENLARLARSLRKWRDKFGASVTDGDISTLESSARRQ
jgi:tRNA A-37 threonylcarbamoyl transferase component Bud32